MIEFDSIFLKKIYSIFPKEKNENSKNYPLLSHPFSLLRCIDQIHESESDYWKQTNFNSSTQLSLSMIFRLISTLIS